MKIVELAYFLLKYMNLTRRGAAEAFLLVWLKQLCTDAGRYWRVPLQTLYIANTHFITRTATVDMNVCGISGWQEKQGTPQG